MREIKFRAWDLEKRRYGEVRHIDYNFEREISSVWCWFSVHEREVYLPEGTFVLEQYTGLKDKHGKEIYEGDIVKLEMWDDRLEKMVYIHTTEVIWNTRYARFDTTHRDVLSDELADDCFEVVGNIHENHELVEEEK